MAQLNWTEEEIYLLADRAYALYRQGRYPEAVVIFEGLTAIEPSNTYCRAALATVCMALGESQRAVKELSFLIRIQPTTRPVPGVARRSVICRIGVTPGRIWPSSAPKASGTTFTGLAGASMPQAHPDQTPSNFADASSITLVSWINQFRRKE